MSKHKTVLSWDAAADLVSSDIVAGRIRHLSVDVFDTLLIRTTSPESVIASTSRFVSETLGVSFSAALAARGEAWGLESADSLNSGNCPDARSDQLFRRWTGLLSAERETADRVASQALSFEVDAESICLAPNEPMKKVLQLAKMHGIGVTALSDMYLSPAEVMRLLSVHGFSDLVGDTVTSAYAGRQKKTGRLFDWYVEEMEGPTGLAHIGDDPIADGRMPSARGIKSIFVYDRSRMRTRHRLASSRSTPYLEAALSATQSFVPENVAEDVGFTRFGPIYTGFVHGVAARAISDGVSSVWFFAREGWLLHELYSVGKEHGLFPSAPPSGYLYASRVATMRAQLLEFGTKEIASIHSDTWSRTYGSTLSPLQIDQTTLTAILDGVRLSIDDNVSDDGFAALKAHKPFVDVVSSIGSGEREGLKAYLERIGFPQTGRVAVVDVGWGGQIQENFEKVLRLIGYTTEVVGYYLGTDERAEARRKSSGAKMSGLVIDKVNNDGCGLGAFSHVQGIELATRSPHGSVKGYSPEGMPRLAPETDKGRKSEAEDDPLIATIQTGILAFAERYTRVASVLNVKAADSIRMARNVIDIASIAPTMVEASLLSDMKNVANLGGDETIRLGGGVSLRHPRHALRVLRTTLWQEGTCALLLPVIGPMALLVARVAKNRIPRRQGVVAATAESNVRASGGDTILADVHELGLSNMRQELHSRYRGQPVSSPLPIESFSDSLRLFVIRLAHRASVKDSVKSVLREARATMKYLACHPRTTSVRQLVAKKH